MLDLLPVQGVLFVDVGTALMAVLPLVFIAVPQPKRTLEPEAAGTGKPSIWQDVRAGLRYVWSWPALVLILLMALLINFFLSPAFSLLPLLVSEHFHGQSWHFATLQSLTGIGMIAGGLVLGAWGGFRRRLYTSFAGLIVVGLGGLAIGLAPSEAFWLAAGAMLVMGFALPIVNGPLLASVQAAVHPEMQGRVFTLISSGASAMTPLGMIIAGPVSDAFGVQTWFLLGGVVTAVMGCAGFFIPALAQFEAGSGAAAPQGEAQESAPAGLAPTPGD